MARQRTTTPPFYRFNSSPEIIRSVVIMYAKFPLSLSNVGDLLAERFTAVRAAFYNHFNKERHLTIRDSFKAQRSAAPG